MTAERTLDLSGEVCPYTFLRAKLALEELAIGDELTVLVDHPPAAVNVPRSLTAEGQQVLSVEARGRHHVIRVVKQRRHHLEHGNDR